MLISVNVALARRPTLLSRLGYLDDDIVRQETFHPTMLPELIPGLRTERGISSYSDTKRVCQLHEALLRQVWMEFHLEDLRFNPRITKNVKNGRSRKVARSKVGEYRCTDSLTVPL
jgi:hypothetical protein